MESKSGPLLARKAELAEREWHLIDQIAGIEARGEKESRQLTAGEREKVTALKTGLVNISDKLDALKQPLREALQADAEAGVLQVERGDNPPEPGPAFMRQAGDPWGTRDVFDTETATQKRSRALAAVDRWSADDDLKQGAYRKLEALLPDEVSGVSEFVLRTSHPHYISAFAKYARDPDGFGAELSEDERRVWSDTKRYLQRAALALSGAVVPAPLDPAIVLSNDGTVDPMRAVARVETTTSKDLTLITSAGVTASYDAELAEVSDDTPSLNGVTITPQKAQAFVQSSIEVWLDQPGFFDTEVSKMFADAKARLEGDKFVTGAGSGSNEPTGIEVALSGTASEVNAAGEALVADDVYGLLEALPPRWQQNARWQLELSTLNFIHRLWNPSGNEPRIVENGQIANVPYTLNSNIDPYSAVDAAATASNRVLIIGDWRQFVVVDRVGLFIEFIRPGHLVNTANNLPDGRVGAYAFWRSSSDSLIDGAFRMLDVETTA